MAMSTLKLQWQQNKQFRLLVTIGGAIIALALFFRFAVFSVNKRIRDLERIIPQKEMRLKELLYISKQYLGVKNKLTAIENRVIKTDKNFNAQSWLEQKAKEAGLTLSQIKEGTQPLAETNVKERVWEIGLLGISLDALSKYLYKIEGVDSPVGIKQVLITKNKNDQSLVDVSMQAYVLIKGD